jgi:Domain of unknown function (DUF1996)
VGPQSLRITSWHCGTSAGSVVHRSAPPLCPPGSLLHLQVNFQDCWDGRRLDSPDHQRPMAYSRRGQCPSTHRVAVPRIGFIVTYPTRGGPGVTLSSGVGRQSAHTAHADFFNAWDQAELARLVRRSINNGPVAKDEAPCPSPRRF